MRIEVATTAATDGDGWSCEVTLAAPDGSTTSHSVRVRRSDLDRFDPGAAEPGDLVRRSFAFLLEREPRESILRAFDLPVIGRYFPEYEREIRRDR
ncbi:MAG TPA: hypothetical protein VFK54_09070 [Candidatus Limnocylindrales bacterium]|nr:hypothetical protein [Candidatus Limnocylindrales bacterium]